MTNFLISRLLYSAVLLVLVSMIGFAVLSLAPGGPMSQYALSPGMSQEELDQIARSRGLDRPLIVQYCSWAGG